jgi:hypothetical protein
VPLFPLIVVREKLARGDRPRDPEPMVMDEPQAVAEYDQIGASVQVAAHQFSALGISRLLPNGGTLIDLGCGSARLLARLAYGCPDARLIGSPSTIRPICPSISRLAWGRWLPWSTPDRPASSQSMTPSRRATKPSSDTDMCRISRR